VNPGYNGNYPRNPSASSAHYNAGYNGNSYGQGGNNYGNSYGHNNNNYGNSYGNGGNNYGSAPSFVPSHNPPYPSSYNSPNNGYVSPSSGYVSPSGYAGRSPGFSESAIHTPTSSIPVIVGLPDVRESDASVSEFAKSARHFDKSVVNFGN
jgi:hypothetical protein